MNIRMTIAAAIAACALSAGADVPFAVSPDYLYRRLKVEPTLPTNFTGKAEVEALWDDVGDSTGKLARVGQPIMTYLSGKIPITWRDDPRLVRPLPPRVVGEAVPVWKDGDDGVKVYRIPALCTAPNGDLVAVADARKEGWPDLFEGNPIWTVRTPSVCRITSSLILPLRACTEATTISRLRTSSRCATKSTTCASMEPTRLGAEISERFRCMGIEDVVVRTTSRRRRSETTIGI